MSRWYLTSSEEAQRQAASMCERAGLRSSAHISGMSSQGQVYWKRAIVTPNFVKCGANDWICSAGTIIYNGQIGAEALQACFSDFEEHGVTAVQTKAIGHYALAIKHNDEISIFTDPQGATSLYYIRTGEFWFVSNSLDLCAGVLSHPKVDPTRMLVMILQSSLPGEKTFFTNIKRVFGTQLVRVDDTLGDFRVEEIPRLKLGLSWSLQSIDAAVEQYKHEVRAVFSALKTVGPMGLFATGGLDSRTILAALVDQNAPVQLMYGVGNSRLTDYDGKDLDVAKTVTTACKLPFQQLDWSGNQPYDDRILQDLFNKYGFNYEIYGSPESFLHSLSGGISPYPKLLLGGYCPAFTNSKPWELQKKVFTFQDLISDSMHYAGGSVEESPCILDKTAYKSAFSADVKRALELADIDYPDTGASLETFVKAKLFLYIRPESRFLNLANEFGHYVAPFLTKRLYEPLLSIPLEYRRNDEFQLRLIHALSPGLTDVPLYSGWAPAHINQKTFRLVREHTEYKPSLPRRVAKLILPARWRKQARSIYSRLRRKRPSIPRMTERDSAILKTYGNAIMSDPLGKHWFSSVAEFTPKMTARIKHYIVAVNVLGYSE